MPTWMNIGKVAKEFGVTTQTIRDWTKQGKLNAVRTFGGHRRYEKDYIDQLLGRSENNKYTLCYARVSASDQKQDLIRQSQELQLYCQKHNFTNVQTIQEIGSGLNYSKRDLKKLINLILTNQVQRVVLSYHDRLVRFGKEIIQQICLHKNVSLIILNNCKEKKFEEQLVQDVLAILTVFCSKIYGKRSHERRKKRKKEQQKEKQKR